jgi:hypothetical protein
MAAVALGQRVANAEFHPGIDARPADPLALGPWARAKPARTRSGIIELGERP